MFIENKEKVMSIKVYLATVNMTLKEFSEKLGYNYSYISRVSNGYTLASVKLAKLIKNLTEGDVILPTQGAKKKEERLLKKLEVLRKEMEV
jgi:transcriptional regulator with XRE-family HTH domain